MNKNPSHSPAYLISLASYKTGMINSGYTENFTFGIEGFTNSNDNRIYQEEQVNIISTLHFEGNDSISEHAALYVIETEDGVKGLCSADDVQRNSSSVDLVQRNSSSVDFRSDLA